MDYAKAFDCVDHNKLWKILKEMEIPDYLTHVLRNLYTGQEANKKNKNKIKIKSKIFIQKKKKTKKNWTWNNRLVPNRKRSTSRIIYVKVYYHPAYLTYMHSTS